MIVQLQKGGEVRGRYSESFSADRTNEMQGVQGKDGSLLQRRCALS